MADDCFFNRCKGVCTCPTPGTYAFTARLMAGDNPSEEEAEFWDRWKDEMKEGGLEAKVWDRPKDEGGL